MKKYEKIKKLDAKYVTQNYGTRPICLVKGKGVKVWDSEGKEYIDFLSGLAVNGLGHCHPEVVKAVARQAKKLIHVSNLYYIEPQVQLAEILVKNSFADKVFFCNSGAEANEAAIKLARKYAKDSGKKGKFKIITAYDSFHGRTLATISATGQKKFHKGFEPMVRGFKYVPFNDLAAMKKAIDKKTCAVMIEPIQGEGGIYVADKKYISGLRKLCNKKGILLIFDEVQCGMGRTGKLFAYEHYGVSPDIMTLAKSLGGGVPIGATLAKEKVAKSFTLSSHASTFGGNPLACAAAKAVLDMLLKKKLIQHADKMGDYFVSKLKELKKICPIKEIRGKGLMIGMEFDKSVDGTKVFKICMKKGLLVNCIKGKIMRFLPPLIVNKKDIDKGLSIPAEASLVSRLMSGDGASAVRIASLRLGASGIRIPFRSAFADVETARLWAAALAFPISQHSARRAVEILVPGLFGVSHA